MTLKSHRWSLVSLALASLAGAVLTYGLLAEPAPAARQVTPVEETARGGLPVPSEELSIDAQAWLAQVPAETISFEECFDLLDDPTKAWKAIDCLADRRARDGSVEDRAKAELETRLRQSQQASGDLAWDRVALAYLIGGTNRARALDLFDEADRRIRHRGPEERFELSRRRFRRLSTRSEFAVLANLAERIGTREAEDRLLIARARLANSQVIDFSPVLDDLDAAIARRAGEDSLLMLDLLTWKGNLAYGFGLSKTARKAREESARLGLRLGLRNRLAWLAFNYALTLPEVEPPSQKLRDRHTHELLEVLVLTEETGDTQQEIRCHAILGQLTSGRKALDHFQTCQDLLGSSDNNRNLQARSECAAGLALALREIDPEAAKLEADTALALAIEAINENGSKGGVWPLAYGWSFWLEHWAYTYSRDEFRAHAEHLIGVLDSVARLQVAEQGSIHAQAGWAEAHYWLSGDSLAPLADRDQPDPAYALWLIELVRGRMLFEGAVRSPYTVSSETIEERKERIKLERDLHLRLLDPEVTGAEVREFEEALRRLAQVDPNLDPPRDLLARLRGALGSDEALLSFQIADPVDRYGRYFGGSWLIVVTRDEVRHYPIDNLGLPSLAEFQRLGSIEPEGQEFLEGWYEGLLREAVEDLPATVDRLVLVPDGDLFLVPFGALGPSAAQPLAGRFDLNVAPSARLWLHWQDHPVDDPGAWALGFADPQLESRPRNAGIDDEFALTRQAPLARLPKSIEEVNSIRAALDDARTYRLTGREASEARLKATDLDNVVLVHFGTHGIVDLERPANSAIGLAPGNGVEDGWLYPEELEKLNFRDRLVVLAACETAVGQTIRTEGAMSLARPVLKAGARAVVASLWPVRDDDAALLFETFYKELGQGRSVGVAMTSAQEALRDAGRPIDSWAAFQVIGDASFRPFPQTSPPP